MTMPCYQYELTVRDGSITPTGVLDGGVSGDKGALQLCYVLADNDAAQYTYRVEVVTALGGYDTTAPTAADNGRITVNVPTAWTVAGTAAVRLVQLCVTDGVETVRRHFPSTAIRFAYRDEGDGAVTAAPLWQEMITRADVAVENAQAAASEAAVAAEVAGAAAETAVERMQAAELRVEQLQHSVEELGSIAVDARSRAELAEQTVGELAGQLGDIEAALDGIIVLQNELIGGDAV